MLLQPRVSGRSSSWCSEPVTWVVDMSVRTLMYTLYLHLPTCSCQTCAALMCGCVSQCRECAESDFLLAPVLLFLLLLLPLQPSLMGGRVLVLLSLLKLQL